MLTYSLEPHSTVPLYEQLYRAIRADITSGALAGGERLPSKRQLAANLSRRTAASTISARISSITAASRSPPGRG